MTYFSSKVYKGLNLNVSVISKMARIAVYGSSHVKRLAQYFKTRPFLFRLKYFCRGGMRADEVDNQSWLDLLEYKPTHVFIHVGGNDISSTSETDDIFLPIKALVQELWRRNVVVMVGEVMPRLSYRDPALTFDIYERKRKSLNDKLRRFLKKNYSPIFVQGLFNGRPHREKTSSNRNCLNIWRVLGWKNEGR